MVTSNKLADKKVVKMGEDNNVDVVPQRTLLGEVNEHITCPLCRGYYIDATTIVECLHSFCRSCIIKHLQVKSYCPECEMMINSARPHIKPDKALQDIVYKLVPGLFQREMERRQQFYASRPGPAASATPEQRGEDTERIIFSPEDVISFSLEFADATDTDSISSKSSDSNEPQSQAGTTRRFLQCPAVVNISHLKKFISMKFDIDMTQFSIDILYKRVPLPDYYTLMDIAYIYNWKRNEPMRFFYQITDFIAIRTRYGLFDINRKGAQFRKPSPTPTEDTNASSPAPNANEPGSEASSGTDSPMLEESNMKKVTENVKKDNNQESGKKEGLEPAPSGSLKNKNDTPSKKPDEDVEKSQFLNSFELKAKSSFGTVKPLSIKLSRDSIKLASDKSNKETPSINSTNNTPKNDESLKRKQHTPPTSPEVKKVKIDMDKIKTPTPVSQSQIPVQGGSTMKTQMPKKSEVQEKKKEVTSPRLVQPVVPPNLTPAPTPSKEVKQSLSMPNQNTSEMTPIKKPTPTPHHMSSPKQKVGDSPSLPAAPKTVSPLKLQLPKTGSSTAKPKLMDPPKHTTKKMPDLKPSVPPLLGVQNKSQTVGKVRMDLLANNSDPTIDRSKILSQVKSSLGNQNPGQSSGEQLKSLFDSCKINIPSSLSITLTDQKDQRNQNETTAVEPKKPVLNKNLSVAGNNNATAHKVPSPPVHNYIEILKLPDNDPKKSGAKIENVPQNKPAIPKNDTSGTPGKPKSSESSAKGPIPSLKPIADTKLGKQSGTGSGVTFQQTFEKQIMSIQSDKTKLPKNKMQVPKLMPATPKALSAANKLNNKPVTPGISTPDNKTTIRNDNALDLSTPHNLHSQMGPQQTKAFETMQVIANLAKKQNLSSKPMPPLSQNSMFSGMQNRQVPGASSMPLRIPSIPSSNPHQTKPDKINVPSTAQVNTVRQDVPKLNPSKPSPSGSNPSTPSPNYSISHSSPSNNVAQPSPRPQTRSPSSSPKLIIAEDKQTTSSELNINQSNQITSTQIPNASATKTEQPKSSPGPSKQIMKPVKSLMQNKMPAARQPMMMGTPAEIQMIQHAAFLRQMEIQNAWFKEQQRLMSQSNNKNNKQ
ncbi:hypothetical protein JYU34_002681 [Plutella xylostella]|uniref:RING-type domain-containing protein n=1 Tax=Plutella xylostella TaxID=51655 RepID=A0ABQ7R2V7_PLUXY|nr:hypothetical protein JYU34_002681 [Plutella xylostella]